MRLSVISDDPGYPAFLELKRRGVGAVVTVDGVKVRYCFTADTDRGSAVVADLNEQGRMQLDAHRGEVKRKELTGNVAIEHARQ